MDAYLKRLHEQKTELVERMHAIIESAEAENRDLSAEENANLAQWDTDFTAKGADIQRLTELEARTRAADGFTATVEPHLRDTRVITPASTDGQRFAAFWRGDAPYFESYRTLPIGGSMEARALQSAGGSAIETSFADFVTVYERTLNPVINVATVLTTADGSPLVFPRLTADAGVASGTVTAEAAGITVGDATISQVTLSAWKRAFMSQWSSELDTDNVIGLQSLIASSIGRQIGLAWGTAFTTGNDSSEARGYLDAIGTVAQLGTANGTTGATANDTFFGPADMNDAFYALAAPYRANASWLVSNTALAKISKFRSTTGEFFYQRNQVPGQPDSYLNRPIYENPAMAAVASAAIAVSVGDFSKYIVREAGPMRVDRSTELLFTTDSIALRVITRRDGDLPDTTAIRAFRCANT